MNFNVSMESDSDLVFISMSEVSREDARQIYDLIKPLLFPDMKNEYRDFWNRAGECSGT